MTVIEKTATSTIPTALFLPWIPVLQLDGTQTKVNLVDLFLNAHNFADLGRLTPIERETLHRFLPTVAALILRNASEDDLDGFCETGAFPPSAVERFATEYEDYFWLQHPAHPFLQRWDIKQSDVDAHVSDTKPLIHDGPKKSVLKPLKQLHPHEPGNSSSKWAIRRDSRDPATDPATLVLLLAVTWWQTRRGQATGIDGRPYENGNPDDAGTWPLSAHWIGPNLGLTLAANTPNQWVDGSDELPMWLSQDNPLPAANLAANLHSLWRTTYARNIAYIYWSDGLPLGHILGPTTYPVPALAETEKEALKGMHTGDYARLFEHQKKKDGTVVTKQLNAPEALISSTEGYVRWYQKELDKALTLWGRDRLIDPSDQHDWKVGIYSEICHGTGNREFCNWFLLNARTLMFKTDDEIGFVGNLNLIYRFALNMAAPMAVACKGRPGANPATLPIAKRQFYADAEGPLQDLIAAVLADIPANWESEAKRFRTLAVATFTTVTNSLINPSTIGQISRARNAYSRSTQREINKVFGTNKTAPTSHADNKGHDHE